MDKKRDTDLQGQFKKQLFELSSSEISEDAEQRPKRKNKSYF